MAHGRKQARLRRRGRGAQIGARSRLDADRHGRALRRRRRRGGRRRGDRRAARRLLHRQQGQAGELDAGRHHRRLRAQSQTAQDRPHRSLSPALARTSEARGDACRLPGSARPGRDPLLRRQQFRCRGPGGAVRAARRRRLRQQSGRLQPQTARHRIWAGAVVARTSRADHGLFADRAGAARARSHARRYSRAPRCDAVPNRALLGAPAARHDGHPQSIERDACARQPGGTRHFPSAKTTSQSSTAPSRRRPAVARSSSCEQCHHRVMQFRCWMRCLPFS